MRELSLFTGAGGGLLGTKLLGWTHVGYVEWNEYCQRVIAARIADGYLDRAPIFTDVREFAQSGAADQYRGVADVVSAGFPCQPFSVAGNQLAGADARNMWPATEEVIRHIQPRAVLLENVRGLVSCGYIGTVLAGLAGLGYVGRWGILGARHIGAPHQRDRLWIVAHAQGESGDGISAVAGSLMESEAQRESGNDCGSPDVAYADSAQRAGVCESIRVRSEHANARGSSRWWSVDPADDPESGVGRMAPRMADGVDRLKAIGNGQVSAVVARAWGLLA